jgi:hypothetical protein
VRQLTALVFVSALCLYVGTSGGSLSSSDATVTFELTRSLVEDHSIALSGNLLGLEQNRGLDGRYYSQYGLGQSLYNVPFYLAGRFVRDTTGLRLGRSNSLLKASVGMGSTVAAAGAVATVFVFAFALCGRASPALIAALACGVGSLLWPYARFGFNAPLTAWLLTATVASLWVGVRFERSRLIAAAGLLAGFAWLTRHEFVLIIGALVVWLALADGASAHGARWRRLALFLPGVLLGGTAWCVYNAIRFGHPLEVGYHPGYSGAGYWGLLASPCDSLFLYSPSVILGFAGLVALARRDRTTAWLLGGPALVHFLFVGALEDWSGGRAYGPRYLVPVLPLLAVAMAPLVQRATTPMRRLMIAVVIISACVQVPGVFVDYSRVSQTWAEHASPDALASRLYDWSSSPLLLNARETVSAIPRNALYLTHRAEPPLVALDMSDERRDFAQQFAFSLDFWWLYLVYLHRLSPPFAIAIGLTLWGTAAWLALRARRLAAMLDATSERHTSLAFAPVHNKTDIRR